MKLRRMTWMWWVELFFGVILPFRTLVPMALVGIHFGMVFTFGFLKQAAGIPPPQGSWSYGPGGIVILCQGLFGLAGLLSLCLLMALRLDQVLQRRALRRFILAGIILGELAALLVLWGSLLGILSVSLNLKKLDLRLVPSSLILLGPMVVGLRYLPQLIRGRTE